MTTVSQTALTVSSHTAPSSPRPPCTPLNRRRTSSTAFFLAAAPPAPSSAPAMLALCRRRKKRTSTASEGSTTQRRNSGASRRYGRTAPSHDDADLVSACPAYRSAAVAGVLRLLLLWTGLVLAARYEAGVTVAVDGVGVSGISGCTPGDTRRRCGFAGTAVCVELLEAEELEGVGEDGREGVGVTAEEGSERAVVLVGGCNEELGGAGADADADDGGSTSGFWTSDARYCSCKEARDAERRYEPGAQLVTDTAELTSTYIYLSALDRKLRLILKELPCIRPLSERGENAHTVHLEHLLVAVLGERGGKPAREPLLDDPAPCGGTANLGAREGERDEYLRGDERGARGGAVRWGEEAHGARVECGEERGARE